MPVQKLPTSVHLDLEKEKLDNIHIMSRTVNKTQKPEQTSIITYELWVPLVL